MFHIPVQYALIGQANYFFSAAVAAAVLGL